MFWLDVRRFLKRLFLDLHYYLFPLHRLRKSGAQIGHHVFWGKNVAVELENAHLLTIEDHVTVSAHCSFILHDSSLQNTAGFDLLYGRILLRKRAYLGAHTIVLPGSEVGEQTIVGAGSIVKGKLKARSVYWGRPAKRRSSLATLVKKWQSRRRTLSRKKSARAPIFFSSKPQQWHRS